MSGRSTVGSIVLAVLGAALVVIGFLGLVLPIIPGVLLLVVGGFLLMQVWKRLFARRNQE